MIAEETLKDYIFSKISQENQISDGRRQRSHDGR